MHARAPERASFIGDLHNNAAVFPRRRRQCRVGIGHGGSLARDAVIGRAIAGESPCTSPTACLDSLSVDTHGTARVH
jgi:hypothetical protein